MGFISNLYQKAQKQNILAGIIISDIIAFIAYVIFPYGFAFFGDVQMVIGVLIGTYFALKHLKKDQTPLKYGMIVALGGSILTAISIYVFLWTIYLIAATFFPLDIITFFILEALIIGLVIGLIEGLYFKNKLSKTNIIKNDTDDAFYESLKMK